MLTMNVTQIEIIDMARMSPLTWVESSSSGCCGSSQRTTTPWLKWVVACSARVTWVSGTTHVGGVPLRPARTSRGPGG